MKRPIGGYTVVLGGRVRPDRSSSVRLAANRFTAAVLSLILMGGCARVAAPLHNAAPPEHPVAAPALGWLAGCWERRSGSLVTEEQWMTPRGGILLGLSRTMRNDSLLEYETMRVFSRDGVLVLAAQPSGQPAAEFAATRVASSRVTFENPTHDFPQRITYEAVTRDSLRATVDGETGGRRREIVFPYGRVACPGGNQ